MLEQRWITLKTHEVVVSAVVSLKLSAIKAVVWLRNCFSLYSGALKTQIINNSSSQGDAGTGCICPTGAANGVLWKIQESACAITTASNKHHVCPGHSQMQRWWTAYKFRRCSKQCTAYNVRNCSKLRRDHKFRRVSQQFRTAYKRSMRFSPCYATLGIPNTKGGRHNVGGAPSDVVQKETSNYTSHVSTYAPVLREDSMAQITEIYDAVLPGVALVNNIQNFNKRSWTPATYTYYLPYYWIH